MIRVIAKKNLHTVNGPVDLNIEFGVKKGELVTLFGDSGVGKTTLLRMIAGLTTPDEGFIEVDGEVWFDSRNNVNLPAQKRPIGFVFQEPGLFPNMTVEKNLLFAAKNPSDFSIIDELLKITHLTEFKRRYPDGLSGGQKQRVALIRAVLRKPKIFLLDEPLSALDYDLRIKLQDEIFDIHKKFNIPTIFVTHDLSEVFKLSNRILWLENGKIKKEGCPRKIFGEQTISEKFKFTGIILDVIQEDFLNILTVQIGNNLTKVVATEEEIKDLNIGDKVLVAAKAFNPIILKYTQPPC